MVQASQQDLAVQQAVEKDLRDYFDAQGMEIGYTALAIEDREQASAQFGVLVQVLMVMTILMAVVGSIGLSGTLSINVIDSTLYYGKLQLSIKNTLQEENTFSNTTQVTILFQKPGCRVTK